MGSIQFTAKIRNFRQLDDVMRKLGKNSLRLMAGALYTEAEDTMTESKATWVPVDLGTLKSTGHVELPVFEGQTVRVRLAYGGPAAPYALKQHEDTTLQHPGQGRAKYLEGPVLERSKDLGARLAKRWGASLRDLL